MNFDQPTRHSLILKLHDVQNQTAWAEFVEIYEPLIERVAIKLGMQKADAVDATQEVLLHLTKVVGQWKPESQNGNVSFRGWLYRVARNVMVRWMQGRDLNAIGTGSENVHSLIEETPQREAEVVDLEFRQQVFVRVAARLQNDFQPRTWNAFWETVVLDRPIDQVARELEMSIGSIYVARSRVMNRIRVAARDACEQHWESGTFALPTDDELHPAGFLERYAK